MARTHGWSGNPPRTDNEAVAQILDATHRCLSRKRNRTTVTEVARGSGSPRHRLPLLSEYRGSPIRELRRGRGRLSRPPRGSRIRNPQSGRHRDRGDRLHGRTATARAVSVRRALITPGRSPVRSQRRNGKRVWAAVLARIGAGWAEEIDEATKEELIEWTLAILHRILPESATRSSHGHGVAPVPEQVARTSVARMPANRIHRQMTPRFSQRLACKGRIELPLEVQPV